MDLDLIKPNSRSVFRAGVSLNIHSFIHDLIKLVDMSFSEVFWDITVSS